MLIWSLRLNKSKAFHFNSVSLFLWHINTDIKLFPGQLQLWLSVASGHALPGNTASTFVLRFLNPRHKKIRPFQRRPDAERRSIWLQLACSSVDFTRNMRVLDLWRAASFKHPSVYLPQWHVGFNGAVQRVLHTNLANCDQRLRCEKLKFHAAYGLCHPGLARSCQYNLHGNSILNTVLPHSGNLGWENAVNLTL